MRHLTHRRLDQPAVEAKASMDIRELPCGHRALVEGLVDGVARIVAAELPLEMEAVGRSVA